MHNSCKLSPAQPAKNPDSDSRFPAHAFGMVGKLIHSRSDRSDLSRLSGVLIGKGLSL